jgi:signal transduction histidine kinase
MGPLIHSSVLIVSDDTEFARSIAACWQAERYVPEITLATSDVWQPASNSGYDLVIVGPVRDGKKSSILKDVSASPGTAAVYVAGEERDIPSLRTEYPHLPVVQRQDGWVRTLIVVSIEALRRVEAADRARRAEHRALACERHATLGRYMLEMRPSVNNALTSVLGNADLLLGEPGQTSAETREQIRTIHTMALRLNEIMQRFSSLASEMQAGEKLSQAETETASSRILMKP